MGSGKSYSMHEIDETRAAAADDAFELIIERVRKEGEITKDEESPMYDDIGQDEAEVGVERVIEFTLGDQDREFRLIRRTKERTVSGEGRNKSLVELDAPKTTTVLKIKDEDSGTWQAVDIDALL